VRLVQALALLVIKALAHPTQPLLHPILSAHSVYGLISLGRNFSPLPAPRKNHKLVTSGLYAHVRHPIYGGLIMAALGLAAISRNEGRLALAILMWVVLEYKASFEENSLVQRYGAEYKAYAAKTKKLIPFLY